ncbi:unnamed protein product [Macrosiphum euphorbiae]|uniref:Uncharacterized protein n=1 Tax=Macrosiphum euphorbiae TaxID=13131 RepID=A0AAV0XVC8_9HEMI|nr:unnamed protein product [Macrosiphum euphorbiae]
MLILVGQTYVKIYVWIFTTNDEAITASEIPASVDMATEPPTTSALITAISTPPHQSLTPPQPSRILKSLSLKTQTPYTLTARPIRQLPRLTQII